jgi:hypothetical protein
MCPVAAIAPYSQHFCHSVLIAPHLTYATLE